MCSSSTSNSASRFSPSGFSPLAGSVVLAMPARPEAYSVGRPSASSAAFCASSSRSEATSSSRSWLSETTSAMRASGRSVLLTHQDHRQVRGQRLAQHEAGLRQRALGGVDQQQHAVDHRQAAFDLAAEVGVARGVDDVDDRHAAVGVLAVHGGVLRQDGDALFLLQVTGVHQAFDGVVTAVGQRAGLPQHRVDQGRLAMVDVSDDGDVAKSRKSTSVIVAVWVPDHENERAERSREVQQARRRQAEEEVLPQQAAVQALPAGAAQGAQGRADRVSAARNSRRSSSAPERPDDLG